MSKPNGFSNLNPYHPPDRFGRIFMYSLLIYGWIGFIVGVVQVDEASRGTLHELPPRVAKLIVAPKPPPPVPVVEVEEAAPVEEPVAEEEPLPVKEEPLPTPEDLAEEERKKNIEIAMNSGLLKLLKQNNSPSDKEKHQEEELKKVLTETGEVKRKVPKPSDGGSGSSRAELTGIDDIMTDIEKSLPSAGGTGKRKGGLIKSGGIDQILGGLLETPEETVLKERKTTAVQNPFKMVGPEDGKNYRSYESIAEVVESYKGGVHFVYNKALRKNPTLEGTITVEFVVNPAGEVLDCRVVSSSVNDPEFEETLVRRVLRWVFPAVPEGTVTITYPLVFSVSG